MERHVTDLSQAGTSGVRGALTSVHHMTIRRRLEEMGIRRERAAPLPARQDEPERRYGYQPAHRRQRPEQH